MNITTITINQDTERKTTSYSIAIGGTTGDVTYFSGQVILTSEELDLSFVLPLVQEKLANSFTKEENLPLELTEK